VAGVCNAVEGFDIHPLHHHDQFVHQGVSCVSRLVGEGGRGIGGGYTDDNLFYLVIIGFGDFEKCLSTVQMKAYFYQSVK
jgi:hypothetical protein